MEKEQERSNMNNINNDESNTNNKNGFRNGNNRQMSEKQLSIITLPYKGQQNEKVLISFKTNLHRSLKVVCTGTKLGSNFQFKDKTKFDHKHDLVYCAKCPECQKDYIDEIGRRRHEQIYDHSEKDSKSHMLKHSLENNHKFVSFEDFHILRNGYTNSKFKRKISKTLFIKELRPSLNSQETYVPLLLYND